MYTLNGELYGTGPLKGVCALVPGTSEYGRLCGKQELRMQVVEFLGYPVVGTLPSNSVGAGSIPGQEAKIPHASQPRDKSIKQKQYCKKSNKGF